MTRKPGDAQATVLGKLIERVRREHKLTTTTLAMLSGLTDAQVNALEEGHAEAFIDPAHQTDCARRIAMAMGLPENHFLEIAPPATSAQRVIRDAARPPSAEQLTREAWAHLPVADLKVLSTLRSLDSPLAPQQRRRGSPLLIALGISLILTGLMLGLTLLR